MVTNAPIVFEGKVLPEWIDYNNHMNDAYYVVAFSKGIDGFMDLIGLNRDYRSAHQLSIYTLQSMTHYLNEVSLNEGFVIRPHIVDHDAKKIHLLLIMEHASTGQLLAAMETMLLHMDMTNHKSAPFTAFILDKIAALSMVFDPEEHQGLIGTKIGIRRKVS